MEHEEVEEIFSGDGSGAVLPCFGMEIPEGDTTVFTLQDILFPDDTPVEISAKIDQGLVAATHILAVNNPLFRTILRYLHVIGNKGLQYLCPEDLCQGLVAEEIPGGFDPP